MTVFAVALQWVGPPGWLLIASAVAGTLLAIWSPRGWLYLLGLGLAMAAWAALIAGTLTGDGAVEAVQPGTARITVEPLRTSCSDNGCWAEARLIRCEPLDPHTCPASGALLSLVTPHELPLGSRCTLLARVALRTPFRNPHPVAVWPDTRARVRARAIDASGVRVEDAPGLARVILHARRAIRHALDTSLAPPHSGVARALLLGEGNAVDGTLNDAIRNAGVSHVLAVSGMHVTVLVGGLTALLRALFLWTPLALRWEARRVSAAVGTGLAPLVAALCGGSPSAVRASLTSTLMFALIAFGRRPQALPVAALAVVVHVALSPRDALHPGFVLSVAATASLLTATTVEGSGIRGALRESLRAWVATAPFLLLCFGTTSLVAIAANVVLLPLGGVLIPVAVAHLGAALVGMSSALGTQTIMEASSGAFVGAARFCANLDPGISLPPPSSPQLVALSGLSALLLLVRSYRVRAFAGLAAAIVCGIAELWLRAGSGAGTLNVWFLDVGQGDAALLQAGTGHTLLIDAGGRIAGGPDPGAASVVPLLRELRIERLDVVVLSHPHPDHYGGLLAVLDTVPVGELWDTGQAEAEAAESADGAARVLAKAREKGVRVVYPGELCARPRKLGEVMLRVFWPCPGFDEGLGPNDNSFVIRMQHGRRSLLFTGDVEHLAEQHLTSRYGAELRSDVLKVAHHGSRTSTTPAMLASVAPRLAVTSAGRGNRFGHPHGTVTERLASSTEYSLRIDQVGGVHVLSDGDTLRVRAFDPKVNLTLFEAPANASVPEAPRSEPPSTRPH